MSWRHFCATLAFAVAVMAASGCACWHKGCRSSCYTPSVAASPCCDGTGVAGAAVPVQAYSTPYGGH